MGRFCGGTGSGGSGGSLPPAVLKTTLEYLTAGGLVASPDAVGAAALGGTAAAPPARRELLS